MSSQPAISQVLHDKNLAILADVARRELLEAIKYERNYSPISWFKSVEIAPRDTGGLLQKVRDGKIERLKLLGKHDSFNRQRRNLVAEICEIEKQLLEGKQ